MGSGDYLKRIVQSIKEKGQLLIKPINQWLDSPRQKRAPQRPERHSGPDPVSVPLPPKKTIPVERASDQSARHSALQKEIDSLQERLRKSNQFKKDVFAYLQDHTHYDHQEQTLYADFEELLMDMLKDEFRLIHYDDRDKPLSDKDLFTVVQLNGVQEVQEKRPASILWKDDRWMVLSKGKIHVPAKNMDNTV